MHQAMSGLSVTCDHKNKMAAHSQVTGNKAAWTSHDRWPRCSLGQIKEWHESITHHLYTIRDPAFLLTLTPTNSNNAKKCHQRPQAKSKEPPWRCCHSTHCLRVLEYRNNRKEIASVCSAVSDVISRETDGHAGKETATATDRVLSDICVCVEDADIVFFLRMLYSFFLLIPLSYQNVCFHLLPGNKGDRIEILTQYAEWSQFCQWIWTFGHISVVNQDICVKFWCADRRWPY